MITTPDLILYKGADANLDFTLDDQDGSAKDITGATISFRIGSIRAQSFTLEKPGTITSAEGGMFRIALTAADTDTLDVRTYDYQYHVTDSSDNMQVVRQGIVDVRYRLPAS